MTHDDVCKELLAERFGKGGVLARPPSYFVSPQVRERKSTARPQGFPLLAHSNSGLDTQDEDSESTGLLTEVFPETDEAAIIERAGGRATNTTTGPDHPPDKPGRG